jgi:parallel beta-helix repeat protein
MSVFLVALFVVSAGLTLVFATNPASGASIAAPAPSLVMGTMDPGGIPHYFGPYANYANSPLPTGSITSITVNSGGRGYTAPVVTVSDAFGTGSGASASSVLSAGSISSISVVSGGSGYSAPVVTITDPTGSGAVATAVMNGPYSGGIRKFIDSLPGLGASNANDLGNYIPIAVPDLTTYPGCDYYEIALVRYTQRMSSDLPATLLNGYVQLQTAANFALSKHVPLFNPDGSIIRLADGSQAIAVDRPYYLGPVIVASRDIPVRVTFHNLLPTGAGGDLFLPVDTTVMGAGMGPLDMMGMPGMKENYTQNRATIHLHGGATPWISDGTPDQWTTPAGETTQYPKGVSVEYVPDMWFVNGSVVPNTVGNINQPVSGATNDPGNGSLTFYYTNQQSARLMFYHDHAYGITRLNVYSGEAAGYLLTDAIENALIDSGIIPSQTGAYLYGIPLVIQDKIFVDASTIAYQDPTWAWGSHPGTPTTGDLWAPHVYMPNQNPYDPTGANPYGRWDYGPWFFPPTTDILHGPMPNIYYDPVNAPWEPPMVPSYPSVSSTMEAFGDTPIVNGQAYPYLNVDPHAYRFRILNAANDRFFNLQLYVADPSVVTADGRMNTEVNMIPSIQPPGSTVSTLPTVPNPAFDGPPMIQIGTEGGFLPAPVVIPDQPITWNNNMKTFTFGNVQDHSLLLGSAERADVIVDFSKYAGKTLILYNDAPAGFPAYDPRNDYFTGDQSQMSSGGAPTTQAGYGPNTRTIMQIRVANITQAPQYDLAALQAAFASTPTHVGVFEASQPPIIVPQSGYDSAYDQTFSSNAFVRIQDTTFNFTTLAGTTLTINLQPKAIHDEMGGSYDVVYGRMSGSMGLEVPSGNAVTQQFIPLGYASPPVDLLTDSMTAITPILGDGTQIWKITHNGVDTHAIHVHLFNMQLINRVGWDGMITPPDTNELGWKDTIRVDPLSDTIVAMRPVAPTLPWEVPSSYRLIDPTLPEGAPLQPPPGGFFDPNANAVTVINHYVNYGWEYVWHCHLLEHEEMDMMHAMPFAVAPYAPSGLSATVNPSDHTKVNLTWIDNSIAETGYIVQRNSANSAFVTIGTIPSSHATTGPTKGNHMYFDDVIVLNGTVYNYRVLANSILGDTASYGALGIGFPTVSVNSTPSNLLRIYSSNNTVIALPSIGSTPPVIPPVVGPPATSYTTPILPLSSLMASNPKTSVSYASHTPIRINSNGDFNSAHGVSTGTGSSSDPYVIEGYSIDGSGFGYGIYVGNTTAFFIVRNCQLTNASGSVHGWEYAPDSGLVFYNVRNGIAANNVLTGNSWSGAYLYRSRDLMVFNQTVSNNYMGIYLDYTNNSVVSFNTLSGNFAGLWLYRSYSNTFGNNTDMHNYLGMFSAASTFNTFLDNTIFANLEYGLWLHDSSRDKIFDNDFRINNGASASYNVFHVQAYDDSGPNFWNGTVYGNFWSDWISPATLGIVNFPYLIDGGAGAKDLHPRALPLVPDRLLTIVVTPGSVSVVGGTTQSFTAQGYSQFGNVMSGLVFTWSTNVGSMTGSTLTARTTIGIGFVRATVGSISGDSIVTITYGALDHIAVTPSVLSIVPNMAQQFTAIAKDVNNNTIPGIVFVWTTNVGTVNVTGLFIASAPTGVTGYVHASSGGKIGSATVSIVAGPLTHIIVTPAKVNVTAGGTQNFSAVGYDQYNNTVTGLSFVWTTMVGTMNGSILTAQNTPGITCWVHATSGVVFGEAMVTIVPGVVTVPSAPTLASATPGNTQVVLVWTAPINNGGAPITGYNVYQGTASGGETLLITLGNVLTYTNTGLTNGQIYYYRVSAINSAGQGGQSNELSATPLTTPSAPTLTSATPGDTQVVLVWTVPASNGGALITGYNVYQGTASGGEVLLTTLGNVLTYTSTGLTNGQIYYFKVSAINSAGPGAQSNELSATPVAVPSAPTLVSATPSNAQVVLVWTAPSSNGGSAITGYNVYQGTASGGETLLITLGNVLTYTSTGLTNGQIYYYKVCAINSLGIGALSNELSATPIGVPSAPVIISATPGNTQIALIWSAPPSNGGSAITGYKVYQGTTSGGEVLLASLGNVLTYTSTGLTNGQVYYFKVSAINSIGEGPLSVETSAIPATVPSAPTLSSAVPGNAQAVLVWTAPSNNGGAAVTGYNVYQGTTSGGETLLITLGNVLTYTGTGLTNGQIYYFKVSAINSAGIGAQSNELSVTPANVPSAPTLVSATPGNTQVVLVWSAPSSNGGAAITGYNVYRGTTSGGETLLITLGNVLTYTSTGLTNGQIYYFKVSAINSAGPGAQSNELSALPPTTPSAPTLASATPSNAQVVLVWTAPSSNGGAAITGYNVYQGTASGGETLLTTLGNVLTYASTGLTNGQTYYFKVSAINFMGEGPLSNERSATPATVPSAPTLISSATNTGGVVLVWAAPSSNGGAAITGYNVYRGTSSGGVTLLIKLGNVLTYTVSSLSTTHYYYQISAVNSVGEGPLSNALYPGSIPAASAAAFVSATPPSGDSIMLFVGVGAIAMLIVAGVVPVMKRKRS